MTTAQAIGIVAQVCAQHVGTLKDHEIIQQALAVIEEKLEPHGPDAAQGAHSGHAAATQGHTAS